MKHKMIRPSKARKAWLDKGANAANTTATEEMLSGSVSLARTPRVHRGGVRYSDGVKHAVEVRSV